MVFFVVVNSVSALSTFARGTRTRGLRELTDYNLRER